MCGGGSAPPKAGSLNSSGLRPASGAQPQKEIKQHVAGRSETFRTSGGRAAQVPTFSVRQLVVCAVGHHLRMEQIKPLPVLRRGDAVGTAAIAGEQLPVGRDVVMHRPFAALQVIPNPFARRDLVAANPEDLAARRLQVVPDPTAVTAEELVSFDLHID